MPLRLLLTIIACALFSSASLAHHDTMTAEEKRTLKKLLIEVPNAPLAAADFSASTSAGNEINLKDLQGKIVFLNFWATWCVPCLEELPDMQELHEMLGKDGLVILGVGMGESAKKIDTFLKKHPVTFTMVPDEDMKISKLYGVQNLPVSYLIDSHGEIYARALGARKWSSKQMLRYFKSKLKALKTAAP